MRKQALQDVLALYEKSDADILNGLALVRNRAPARACPALTAAPVSQFTQRFKARFAEMTSDSDAGVASTAIKLMNALLRTERLDDNDGESIPSYVSRSRSTCLVQL